MTQPDVVRDVGTRRDRVDIRELLLDAAIVEFGKHGYEGASTNTIARRADAHQPQINHHLSNKAQLWRAAVDELFARIEIRQSALRAVEDPAERLAALIRSVVEFTAEQPELSQIMMHEATKPSDRLEWMVANHVQWRFDALAAVWVDVRELGVAAPIDSRVAYHVLNGAAVSMYINRDEAQQSIGRDPRDPEMIEAHVEGLIATLLPGYRP